ncbi:MAG: RNA 2',3'-cyclic phosphodiesterase [Chloroflexi bacterium]|nr:RNA 2',3'-cyclic phosphodiesterase [Chloroflexota bacterium]
MADKSLRAFVALPLPDAVKLALSQVQRRLRAVAEGRLVKWVEPGAMHLTLKFLGEIPPQQVAPIGEAVQRASEGAPPFTLRLDALGAFPSGQRPRVVWAGASSVVEQCATLFQRVEQELRPLGFPAETRPFAAHVTLGRVRDQAPATALLGLADVLASAARLEPALEAAIDRVVLFKSTLTPKGAHYEPLALAPLLGPP